MRLQIKPTLGGVRLGALLHEAVEKAYGTVGRALAPTAILERHLVLSRALTDALRFGKVTRYVSRLVEPPGKPRYRTTPQPATRPVRCLRWHAYNRGTPGGPWPRASGRAGSRPGRPGRRGPSRSRYPTSSGARSCEAEAFNSLFKAELVRSKGPWKNIDDLEIAVAEYIDWFNLRRLHGEIGPFPPVEHEHQHQHQHQHYRHQHATAPVDA